MAVWMSGTVIFVDCGGHRVGRVWRAGDVRRIGRVRRIGQRLASYEYNVVSCRVVSRRVASCRSRALSAMRAGALTFARHLCS